MAMVAGRDQEPDVYMTSRPLVRGSEPTFTLSAVRTHTHTHTHARTHTHTRARSLEVRKRPIFFGLLVVGHVIKRYARKRDFVGILVWLPCQVGPCHHGMARPQVADGGTASDKEGSCE
jgi:hypothetical protein